MNRFRTRLRAGGGGGFNPYSALWPASSSPGFFLAPWEVTDAYRDAAGIAAGVVGQPVGLRLDRRFGLTRGMEVVGNTSMDSAAYWNDSSASVSFSAAGATFTAAPSGNRIRGLATVQANKTYEAIWQLSSIANGAVYPQVSAGDAIPSGAGTAAGTHRQIFTASALASIGLRAGGVTDAQVAFFSLRELPGNHFTQATTSARPNLTLEGATYFDLHDAIDDGSATAAFAAGTLTSNMDLFIAVRGYGGADLIVASEDTADATRFIGKLQAGEATSGSACAGVGSAWTAWVNGVQAGGTATTTAAALKTAIGTGAWKILELRNLDLSAWAKFTWGQYTGFQLDADLGGRIACAAQADSVRTQIRNLLAQKVGLSL